MPERNELDIWAIPKALRAKIFTFGLTGLFATCGYLYYDNKLCYNGWRKDTERFMNIVVEVANKRADEKSEAKMKQASNEISERQELALRRLDSLQAQLNVIKN